MIPSLRRVRLQSLSRDWLINATLQRIVRAAVRCRFELLMSGRGQMTASAKVQNDEQIPEPLCRIDGLTEGDIHSPSVLSSNALVSGGAFSAHTAIDDPPQPPIRRRVAATSP